MKYQVTVEEHTFEIEVDQAGQVWIDRHPVDIDMVGINGLPTYSLLMNNRSYETHVESSGEGECQVVVAGRSYRTYLQTGVPTPGQKSTACVVGGPAEIVAPLPGLVVEVCVEEGQPVEKNQVVVILDSMKMNMELRATRSGVVQSLNVEAGQEVGLKEVLVTIREL